jgi:hypothetical protein
MFFITYEILNVFYIYLAVIAARAIELSLVSMLSARLDNTHGAFAPATIAAILTPGVN